MSTKFKWKVGVVKKAIRPDIGYIGRGACVSVAQLYNCEHESRYFMKYRGEITEISDIQFNQLEIYS